MNRLLRGILTFLPIVCLAAAQTTDSGKDAQHNSNGTGSPVSEVGNNGYMNGNGFNESRNRLPLLLRDVKVYLTDALGADIHSDTLEVIYNLNRIFDLLTEADQLGDMNEDDREEFDRFEFTLVDVYTHKLTTLKASDVPVTAEQLRIEVTEYTEPLEVEMGRSKFIVVDDRDGHIPLVRNKKVDQFIQFFQTKGKKQFKIWLSRYMVYGEMITGMLKENELPEELVYLAMIESGFNPKAYSRANASGMWQFIYSTAKKYGLQRNWYIDERRDPIKATHAACKYLKDLYKEFDNWYLALAAYNAGSGRILRATRLHQTYDFWQLHSLPKETRNYIPYFLAAAIIARNPEEYGFKINEATPFAYNEVVLEKSADLAVVAQSAGISVKTLRDYNPELRQSATPNEENYTLKLPQGKKEKFEAVFTALPEDQRFAPQYIVHRVRRGQSLWSIAKKYRVSIHDLAAVNKIRNRHSIRIGQKLTIPVRGGNQPVTATTRYSNLPGHKKVVYTVKRGDTLGHIAENFGTRSSRIRQWNGLRYGQYIFPGQKLVVWVKES